jgi:tyrosyl-tRNA synthetase
MWTWRYRTKIQYPLRTRYARYFGQPQQIAGCLHPDGTDGVNKKSKSLNNYIAVFDTPADKFGKVMSIPV